MSRVGDVAYNPVTGERAVVRVGTEDSGGELLAVEMCARPGAAVAGEHYHPSIDESFTVVRGCIHYRLDGREGIAEAGEQLEVPAGAVHDWWNAGDEEARVIVEIRPGARFEEMILNLFGLAQDGRTNSKGMPGLLQAALFAREFEDAIVFTRPPRIVQSLLFGLLAPIGRIRGLRGSYPEYLARELGRVEAEPRPGAFAVDALRE